MEGHPPPPVLAPHEDEEQVLFRKLPSSKDLSGITRRIPEGIAPGSKIDEMDPRTF